MTELQAAMTTKVYTMGYSGRKMPEIQEIVESLNAVIFDIRFTPRSRYVPWNGSNFRRVFGGRYEHVKAFGNAAYKTGGIRLVNYEEGKARIKASERPVILMCGCKDYQTCHRRHIAERLREDGFIIQEINLPQRSRKRKVTQQKKLL